MRRLFLVFATALTVAALIPVAADGAPQIVANIKLDPAPSWQNANQRLEMGAWVKHSSPVVADLGDGPVILVGSLNGKLYALKYRNGSLTKVWDSGTAIDTFIDSSPAVGDLNGDGCPEVVVGAGNEFHPKNSGVHVFDCHGRNHRFWPGTVGDIPNHVGVFSSPAIGDVTGDGSPEVVYGSFDQKIYVKDRNGKDLPGWPHQNFDTIWSSPALADINGDGKKEIIIGTDLGGGDAVFGCPKPTRGTIKIFDGGGNFMPNFPKCLDTPIWSSPSVQDINGDGTLDVVIGTNNYRENGVVVGDPRFARAFDSKSGRLIWQTALGSGTRIFSSAAIGDVGGDGSLDVAFGTLPATNYGEVFLLDAHTGRVRWHHEGGHREICACMFMGSPTIADVDGDGRPEVVATSQVGSISAWDEAGNTVIDNLHLPENIGSPPGNGSYMFFNSPAVADTDGNGTNEIVAAGGLSGTNPRTGMVWIVSTPGRGQGPWPMFKRTPDRIASLGSGPPGGAAAPRPPATSTVGRRRPARQAVATSAPTPTPTSPTASPTSAPLSYVVPRRENPNDTPRMVIGLIAAGVALSAAGVAIAANRKRVIG